MNNTKIILDGYKRGDKNGGPTELAKILSNSLLASNGFNKNDLVKRYHHWWNTDAFDTGPTFAMVFQKLTKGYSIEEASKKIDKQLNGATAGCGPAHRISPIAGYTKIPTNQLVDYARQEAAITHYHPMAGNCSAIMALLCRYLIEGNSWIESKKIVKQNEDLKSTWIKIEKANLNNGGYVLDVMHSAMFFLDRKNSLEDALSFAGPANYCPVIVGIIQNIINKIEK
jgi:ADP-ribosylglycohydrolase